MNQQDNSKRTLVLYILCFVSLFIVMGRLINLQITNGEYYRTQSEQKVLRTTPVKATRGEIFDRYGRPLVTNRTCFNLQIDKLSMGSNDLNDLIINTIRLLDENKETYDDILPISDYPFTYTIDMNDTQNSDVKRLKNLIDTLKLDSNITAPELIDKLSEYYEVKKDLTPNEARKLISIRYEMENRGFSAENPFLISSDISIEAVTKINEYSDVYQGLDVVVEPVREYVDGTLASHILGRIGSIYKEEYDSLKEQGYLMNDLVGKDGMEKALEQYLRGKNGMKTVVQNIFGKVIDESADVSPVPGENCILTIDKKLQTVAQNSLKSTIERISSNAKPTGQKGYDADAGAVVALDVNSGEVLAMASYPTFDLSTFSQNYSTLYSDPKKPMFDRALSGIYEPGSTFKMLTAIAGLQEKVITQSTVITCTGHYEYFAPAYRPTCWIYSQQGTTHGSLTVRGALEKSCNIFFFETGRLLGIERLNQYSRLFGFGEYTGIELSGESKGVLAGKDDSFAKGKTWYDGQTIQAAIGQSDNLFTPLQLCNYISTIANGGTRYNVHLLKSVRDYNTGEAVINVQPKAANKLDIRQDVYDTVVDGMRRVTEDGTASSVFANYPIAVAGKTGSAEVSSGSANGVFVAFAPADNPQIAIAIVVEHGAHGNSVAPIARDIFDAYFASNHDDSVIASSDTLIS